MLRKEHSKAQGNNLGIDQIYVYRAKVSIPVLPSRFNPTYESYY